MRGCIARQPVRLLSSRSHFLRRCVVTERSSRVTGGWARRIELIASLGLTAAALAMAVAVVHGEITRARTGRAYDRLPAHYSNWQVLDRHGRNLDNRQAPIEIVEFADLECPACRNFAQQVLPEVRKRFAQNVSVTFVHLPLSIHRFAGIAAKAAECAAEQGRFADFVQTTYDKQDSLGLAPWSSLALQSGVIDTTAFDGCLAKNPRPALIDSGTALAKRMGLNATPTIVINGWRLPTAESDEIDRVIEDLLHHRVPYPNLAETAIQD